MHDLALFNEIPSYENEKNVYVLLNIISETFNKCKLLGILRKRKISFVLVINESISMNSNYLGRICLGIC